MLTEVHLTATECHLPYGITQCNLSPDTRTPPTLTPARQAGSRFIVPGGMEGRVDLGDRLHAEKVYLVTDSRPSKY